jgi:hypothetical protein
MMHLRIREQAGIHPAYELTRNTERHICLWSNVPSSRDSESSNKKDPRQQIARTRSVGRDEISIVGRWKNGMQTSA